MKKPTKTSYFEKNPPSLEAAASLDFVIVFTVLTVPVNWQKSVLFVESGPSEYKVIMTM